MITKEFTINHSVDEIKGAMQNLQSRNTKFENLEFQDGFSMIKIIGTIFMKAIVTIELYYEELPLGKTKVKIVYIGSGAKQSINEANEASFERDFSKLFITFLTTPIDNIPKDASCLIIFLVLSSSVIFGIAQLIRCII